jgi:hypothetical protein
MRKSVVTSAVKDFSSPVVVPPRGTLGPNLLSAGLRSRRVRVKVPPDGIVHIMVAGTVVRGAACATVEPWISRLFSVIGEARRALRRSTGPDSRGRLDKALAAGRIVRVRRGLYCVPNEAGVLGLALQHNALVTCLSAAPVYQLWTLEKAGLVHLSAGHKKAVPGTITHGRLLHPVHPWLPVAGLADVLIHALHCLPVLEALVMVQCASQRGDVTLEFLRRKLPGNRNARARAVLDHVIPRADSILEVLANYHFRRAGLHIRRHVELQGVGEVERYGGRRASLPAVRL